MFSLVDHGYSPFDFLLTHHSEFDLRDLFEEHFWFRHYRGFGLLLNFYLLLLFLFLKDWNESMVSQSLVDEIVEGFLKLHLIDTV